MDEIRNSEELITNSLTAIVNAKKAQFLISGHSLDLDIERVTSESAYESEAYVLLKREDEVVELYPIQIVLALKDEEPVLFVGEQNLLDLEDEVRTEIKRWEDKYLTRTRSL